MSSKPTLQQALDGAFARLSVWCLRHYRLVLMAAVALLGLGLYGATLVRQDNSLDSYFDESDPAYSYYKKYIAEFSSDEVTYLLYSAPDKANGPFDIEVMQRIAQLTTALEKEVPFVRKVTSLANAELIVAQGDDIAIHALVEDTPQSQDELLRLKRIALSKPLYVNSIISKDGKYGAVVVEMTRTSTDPIAKLRLDPKGGDGLDNLYPQVPNSKIHEILKRPEYRGIKFLISGDVPMNATYNVVIGADIPKLTLITFVLVSLMSVLFLGVRVVGLLAPLAVVLLALVCMLGLMGFVGWKINLFFLMVPTLICATGVAQVVHVLMAWQHESAHQPNAAEAVRSTMTKVATPCLMVALTDVVGYSGTGISNLRALGEMSWYASLGVMMTFVLSITLLIALAGRSKQTSRRAKPVWSVALLSRALLKLARFNGRHPGKIILVFSLLLAASGAGIAKLKVDFNFLEEFKPEIEWRAHTEQINQLMGGILSVVYVFDTETPDGIKDPALVQHVEALQKIAESLPVVQDSASVADILKELNQAFHGGDAAYHQVPTERDSLAQLLLVYELSGGKEINDVINVDRSKTVLQVRLKLVAASGVRVFLDAMDAYIKTHPMAGVKVEVSGIGLLWVRMADYISKTQIQGYTLTFGLIALFMMITFGSVKLGLLAMIPNTFPIILVMGGMGYAGWHLDYMRLLLATIAIGIAVDDTIHFMASYKREFEHCGNYQLALERTLPEIGPAMVAMTVILVVAFSSYFASQMAILTSFGVLLSCTIGIALFSDLLLMPALLLWLKPLGPERSEKP